MVAGCPLLAPAECAVVAVAQLHCRAAAGVVPGRGWAATVRALASAQAVVRGPPVATEASISLIAVAVDAISARADTLDTTSHGTVSAGRTAASASTTTVTSIATNGDQPHTAGSGSTSATATTVDPTGLHRGVSLGLAKVTCAACPVCWPRVASRELAGDRLTGRQQHTLRPQFSSSSAASIRRCSTRSLRSRITTMATKPIRRFWSGVRV